MLHPFLRALWAEKRSEAVFGVIMAALSWLAGTIGTGMFSQNWLLASVFGLLIALMVLVWMIGQRILANLQKQKLAAAMAQRIRERIKSIPENESPAWDTWPDTIEAFLRGMAGLHVTNMRLKSRMLRDLLNRQTDRHAVAGEFLESLAFELEAGAATF
jgi:hypothetical protein